MSYKETKIHVVCAISRQPEIVYVRSVDYQDVHLKEFNGCDNYHCCQECDVTCRATAMEKYTRLIVEEVPWWMHKP